MAEATKPSKTGLTRGKAILIGVLSVVLVVILYVQFGGKGEKPADEAANYRPPRPALAVQTATSTTKPMTVASSAVPSNGQASKDKGAVPAALIDETRWKSPKLETVVAYDPFALPPAFPQRATVKVGKTNGGDALIAAVTADDAKKLAEAVKKSHMELEELRQQGVHVITRDLEGGQFVAWIGDRKLHVGDEINGFTVTAIDPDDGVHVEKKESP